MQVGTFDVDFHYIDNMLICSVYLGDQNVVGLKKAKPQYGLYGVRKLL